MQTVDVEQGSAEWLSLRLAIPTASQFHRILTPKTRKFSEGSRTYMHELLAEWLIGTSITTGSGTGYMERGTQLEAEAASWYELQRDLSITRAPFYLLDDGSAGCSPDYLAGDDGLVEIKCYEIRHHIAALLGEVDDHVTQVQGQLWLTGRQWCDVVFYNGDQPSVVSRLVRDQDHISLLTIAVDAFNDRLRAAKNTLRQAGCIPKLDERNAA